MRKRGQAVNGLKREVKKHPQTTFNPSQFDLSAARRGTEMNRYLLFQPLAP